MAHVTETQVTVSALPFSDPDSRLCRAYVELRRDGRWVITDGTAAPMFLDRNGKWDHRGDADYADWARDNCFDRDEAIAIASEAVDTDWAAARATAAYYDRSRSNWKSGRAGAAGN